jgi:hypothetical protein
MAAVEGFATAGIEEHEVVFAAAFYGFEHVVPLLFGVQLVSEVFLISANVVGCEAHARNLLQSYGNSPTLAHVDIAFLRKQANHRPSDASKRT